MDKEQKKLLLVAISVGVFLLVTITIALILLTPKVKTEETAFSSSRPVSPAIIQPADNVNITLQPVADSSQAANINTNSENSEPAAAVRNDTHMTIEIPTTAGVPNNPVITTTSPSTPSRPAVNQTSAATQAPAASQTSAASQAPTATQTSAASQAPAASQTPATQTSADASTTAAQSTSSRPAAAATPAPASQPAVTRPVAATRQTTPARTINDYWIQTGAYSAIVRAEDAKELLASKGFISIIETRVIDGRNLYRVRLGPYTSEREANYWLTLVRAIDGFGDSQIRQTTRQQ